MRVDVLRRDRLRRAGSVALLVVTGIVSGCSSDVARFDDGFYTGAVPQQPVPRMGINQGAPGGQGYPGDLDRAQTGSIAQGALPAYGNNPGAGVRQGAVGQTYGSGATYGQAPVTRTASVERTMLAPPSGSQAYPASPAPQPSYPQPAPVQPAPVQAAPARPAPQAARPSAEAAPKSAGQSSGKPGWHNTGNMVTLRQGETIEAISNRYGVPAKAILAANGMTSASQAAAGQQIQIPSYSYGQSRNAAAAPVQTLGTPPGPLKAPSAAPATAAAAPGASITVEPGDSLMGIARRTGVSVADLRSANGISGDDIRIGQRLALPGGAKAPTRVASLDKTVAPPAAKPAAQPQTQAQPKPYEAPQKVAAPAAPAVAAAEPKPAAPPIAAAPKVEAPKSSVSAEAENDVATAAPEGTGISQFRWPVQGRVVKRFGDKSGARRSDGVDISVPRGTSVKAAENGVVIYAGDGLKEFGNTVLVKHDNGLVTVYGHADELKVKRGATVRRGQEIATAGVSGDTDTPKVHFEVRKNSSPVDPMTFLQ